MYVLFKDGTYIRRWYNHSEVFHKKLFGISNNIICYTRANIIYVYV